MTRLTVFAREGHPQAGRFDCEKFAEENCKKSRNVPITRSLNPIAPAGFERTPLIGRSNSISICLQAVLLLVIGAWLVAASVQLASAQDEPTEPTRPSFQEDGLPDDLVPEGAIWRFGNYDNEETHSGFYRLKYSRDGRMLAARDRENLVTIFDTKTQRMISSVQGHEAWVGTIDFSPDGKFFLTGAIGPGERVKIWNIESGKLALELNTEAYAAYFSKDGSKLLVLNDSHVTSYAWPSGALLEKRKWRSGRENPMNMSEDGQLVAFYKSTNDRHQLFVRDLENKSTVVVNGPAKTPKRVLFSPNNLWVAACYSRDAKVRLWDLREPQSKNFILTGHTLAAYSLAFSPDNRLLATTSGDKTAIVWDILTREKVAHMKAHEDNVNSVAFSPLDYKLATGSSGKKDCTTIIWDIKRELFPTPEPDLPDEMNQVAFDEIWTEMGSSRPRQSLNGTRKLVLGGANFISMIETKIGIATKTVSSEEIARLVSLLNSPKYAVRAEATEMLKKLRGHAEAYLRQTLASTESSEIRYRVTKILKQPVTRPKINFQELRRLHRCILALEMIASNEALDVEGTDRNEIKQRAVAVLEAIAGGHANIDVALDASDSLERIKKR